MNMKKIDKIFNRIDEQLFIRFKFRGKRYRWYPLQLMIYILVSVLAIVAANITYQLGWFV